MRAEIHPVDFYSAPRCSYCLELRLGLQLQLRRLPGQRGALHAVVCVCVCVCLSFDTTTGLGSEAAEQSKNPGKMENCCGTHVINLITRSVIRGDALAGLRDRGKGARTREWRVGVQ